MSIVRGTPLLIGVGLLFLVLSLPRILVELVLEPSGSATAGAEGLSALATAGPSPFGTSAAAQLPGSIGWGAQLYATLVTFTVVGLLAVLFAQRLRGDEADLSAAWQGVRANALPLAVWVLVQAVIVTGLSLGSEAPGGLAIQSVAWVAQVLWGLATFFVVPAIVLDDLDPMPAFRRSLAVARREWAAALVVLILVALALTLLAVIVGMVLGPPIGAMIGSLTDSMGATGAIAVATLVMTAIMAVPIAVFQAATAGVQVILYEDTEDANAAEPPASTTS